MIREPNFFKFSRFFGFLDRAILKRLLKLIRPPVFQSEFSELNAVVEGLSHIRADVAGSGFHIAQLAEFLRSRHLEIVFAYSYHWIFPDSNEGLLQQLLAKSNFVIEKIPLSEKFGRYISVITRKNECAARLIKEHAS